MISMRKYIGVLGINTFQGVYLFVLQGCPRLRIGSDRSQMLLQGCFASSSNLFLFPSESGIKRVTNYDEGLCL